MRTFSPRRRPARRNLRAFAHGTRGSISVEYALWTTMFGVAFTLIADLTSVFTANTEMWHVGQDAARRLSVAEMGVQEAESFVRGALAPRFGDTVEVTARSSDPITVEISAPFSEVTVFGMAPGLDAGRLNARLVIRDEVAAMEAIRAAAEAEADLALADGALAGG